MYCAAGKKRRPHSPSSVMQVRAGWRWSLAQYVGPMPGVDMDATAPVGAGGVFRPPLPGIPGFQRWKRSGDRTRRIAGLSIHGWGCFRPQSGSWSRQYGAFRRWRLWRRPVLHPFTRVFFLGLDARTLVVTIMSLVLIWRHKSNIASLLAGTEPRIGKQSAP